jgi:hypothetical protein
MPNPFSWDHLTTQPASDEVLNGFTIVYAAVMLLGFVGAAYLHYRPWTKPFGKLFRRRSVLRATFLAMWVFGTGLFFFLIRLLQINPFSFGEPIWMWLSLLAVVVMFVIIGMSWNSSRAAAHAAQVDARRRITAPRTANTVKRPVRRDKAHR